MVDLIQYGEFKTTGKNKRKKQIILCHSSRNIENYLMSLKYRYNGKFSRIPNYVIDKEGKVLKLINDDEFSEYFQDYYINKNSIIIVLENLGWLRKEPLKDYYVNWIGDIYKGKAFEKRWRDYFFWEPYTEEQINSTFELCKYLFDKIGINNEIIEHNVKIPDIEKVDGVVTKSNFDTKYTDLSPAFDFNEFIKKFKNE